MTEPCDLSPAKPRSILGHFATGLAVITAASEDGPAGSTCQFFSSLSLDPALVTFSPARTSSTWPLLHAAGRFTVNILPEEHQEYDGGAHTIVVGGVRALSGRADAEPMLFFEG